VPSVPVFRNAEVHIEPLLIGREGAFERSRRRRVFIEYLMLAAVNDSSLAPAVVRRAAAVAAAEDRELVLVTVVPARTPKLSAAPSGTEVAAPAVAASARNEPRPTMPANCFRLPPRQPTPSKRKTWSPSTCPARCR